MVKSILRSLALLFFSLSARSQDYPVQPVPFTQVHLTDNFWEPKLHMAFFGKGTFIVTVQLSDITWN